MSDEIEFQLEALNKRQAQDIEDAIESGIKKSVTERGHSSLPEGMEDAAKQRIRNTDRTWRETLIESFDWTVTREGDDWLLVFENDAEHARTINYGRTPGKKKPPLAEMIAWAEEHLADWDIDPDYLSGGVIMADGGWTEELPKDQQPVGIALASQDYGIEGGVNEDSTFVLTYDGGSKTFFKSSQRSLSYGSAEDDRGEAAFSRLADEFGFEISPETRYTTHTFRNSPRIAEVLGLDSANEPKTVSIAGSEAPFIEDRVSLAEKRLDMDDAEILSNNANEFAETTMLDAVISNSDRHYGNVMFDERGRFHAIDNGGHAEGNNLRVTGGMIRGPRALSGGASEELHDAVEDIVDRQLEIRREILDNREKIIDILEEYFGPDHWRVERFETITENDGSTFIRHIDSAHSDWLDATDPDFGSDVPDPDPPSYIRSLDQDGTVVEDILDDIMDDLDNL